MQIRHQRADRRAPANIEQGDAPVLVVCRVLLFARQHCRCIVSYAPDLTCSKLTRMGRVRDSIVVAAGLSVMLSASACDDSTPQHRRLAPS